MSQHERDTASPAPGQKRKRISGNSELTHFFPDQSLTCHYLVACDECRARKSRCDGVRPTCQSCTFHGVPCIYEVPKPKANVTKEYLLANFKS